MIPLALGLVLFTRFSRKYSYLSRYMMAILIASAIGAGMISSAQTRLFKAVEATIPTFSGDPATVLGELVLIIAVFTTLILFTFTRKHEGVYGRFALIGRIALMVALGANFGNAFSTRLGYVIGRLNYLLIDWLQIA